MKNDIIIKQLAILLFCFTYLANLSAQETEMRFKVHGKIIDARTKNGHAFQQSN